MRVLLVEDEVALADALQFLLEKNQYHVDVAYDGITGEDYALSNHYDILILDRMLPGQDGLSILKAVRAAQNKVPAMFLTARDTINDRVEGLDAGADDYLIKPFANKEFLARVNALSRRNAEMVLDHTLSIAGAQLDTSKFIFSYLGTDCQLTRTESELLELLIRNAGQVLQKEQILDRIWGYDKDVELGNVELYIFYLRKKIHFKNIGLEIKTIRSIGYSLREIAND